MGIVVMRHGARDQRIDSPLLQYRSEAKETCCPEVWRSIQALAPHVERGELQTIISSPYLRTRQTAELLQYGLSKLTGKYLPIRIDTAVGEYMHRRCPWKVPTNDDFDPVTVQHYNSRVPLCRESPDMFVMRVHHFYETLEDKALIVTHNGVAGLLGVLVGQDIQLDVGRWALLETEVATPVFMTE